MASFRDAEPSVRVAFFFLTLLLSPGSAQRALPRFEGVTGNYTTLGEVLKALQSQTSGSAVPGGRFADLFKGFSLTPFRTVDPANAPPRFPSFGIPQLPQFSGSLPGIFNAPIDAITPEPLAPDVQQLLRMVGAIDGGGDYVPTAEETAEAVAILALLSGIFNLVAAILYIVSGALGTTAASLSLIPITLGLLTGPLSFFLASEAFSDKLGADRQSVIDGRSSDWTQGLTRLATTLKDINSGALRSQLTGLRNQLFDVKDLLASASKYNITSLAI